nr:DivIVA domain-containing protein [Micromonospora sp. DSM 115978]
MRTMEDEHGTLYRSDGRALITPQDIHDKCFSPTRFGRRGLEPTEVHDFLKLIEGEVAVLHSELAAAREEAGRLKNALREWQSQHGACYQRGRQDGHQIYRRPTGTNQARPPVPPHPRERREQA